jgi:pyruvate,orthophosphate dikinase
LQEAMPELYRQLHQAARQLERLFRDAQDFEFTIQEGRLFLLQSSDARRTALAALRIACEQVGEGLIDEATALGRLEPYDLAEAHTVRLAAAEGSRPVAVGVPASPGVAVGEAVFDPERAVALAGAGRTPILIRTDISTTDIAGLAASAGCSRRAAGGPRTPRSWPASSTRSVS